MSSIGQRVATTLGTPAARKARATLIDPSSPRSSPRAGAAGRQHHDSRPRQAQCGNGTHVQLPFPAGARRRQESRAGVTRPGVADEMNDIRTRGLRRKLVRPAVSGEQSRHIAVAFGDSITLALRVGKLAGVNRRPPPDRK